VHVISLFVVYYGYSVYYVYLDKRENDVNTLLLMVESLTAGIMYALLGLMAYFWIIFIASLLLMAIAVLCVYFGARSLGVSVRRSVDYGSIILIIATLTTAGSQNLYLLWGAPVFLYIEYRRNNRLQKVMS